MISIKFSPDKRILGIQRSNKSVVRKVIRLYKYSQFLKCNLSIHLFKKKYVYIEPLKRSDAMQGTPYHWEIQE